MKLVHTLVAEAFIPNPENKREVNHIDGNKGNSHVANLEWVTHRENIKHSYETGLKMPKYKKINQYDKNNNFIKQWESMKNIVDELGIDYGLLSRCCHGKNKTASGFIWRFST